MSRPLSPRRAGAGPEPRRSPFRRRVVARGWPIVVALLTLVACEEDKPFTPFEVATSLPTSPEPPPPPQPTATAEPPAEGDALLRRALKAPREAKTWTVEGRPLQAPDNHVFELALPLPPTKDAKDGASPEVIVWSRRPAQGSAPASGALWLYGDSSPRQLAELPGFVPVSPDCEHVASLDQTGPHTVTVDVTARCTARLVARAPTRSVLVVDPRRAEPVLMGFRAADPAPGETLELQVDSRDLDDDGRDDITLRVTVGHKDRKASARFVWFDRAAGRSRESKEPATSFSAVAARLATTSKGSKGAASVAGEADAARRLYATACGESGTPRLWAANGTTLTCSADTAVAALLGAEITAALTLDRSLEALGLLERDGWYGAKLPSKERERLEKLAVGKVQKVSPEMAGAFMAHLPPRPAEPRFSPLHFDTSGRLWVRNAEARVLASDPPGSPPSDPALGAGGNPQRGDVPDVWPLRVVDQAGRTWTGVVPSCDRSELQLSFVSRDGMPSPPQPLALLAPRPGSCQRAGALAAPTGTPIAWHGNQLEAWLAGHHLGAPASPLPGRPGSPRSPDGKALVVPSRHGLLVQRDGGVELWQGELTQALTDCVPSSGARQIACVKGRSSVVVLKRPGG